MAETSGTPLVVSINIPFCPRRCSFCAKDVVTPPEPEPARPAVGRRAPVRELTRAQRLGDLTLRDDYLTALEREFESMAPDLGEYEVEAIRVTGGIPTSCSARGLAALLRQMRESLRFGEGVQISMQTVPGGLGADALGTYKAAGITHYEFLAGSFSFFEWECLGRPVAFDTPAASVELLRCYHVDEIGFELFSGLPGQTERTFAESCKKAGELGARRLRLTKLPLAEGTPLYRQFVVGEQALDLSRSDLRLPSDDAARSMLEHAAELLGREGWTQYAPGCLALAGCEDAYEVLRGQGCDYITLGLGGESVVDGLKTVNTTDLRRYVRYAHDPAGVVATVQDLTL